MQNRNKIITTILLALGFFALPQAAQSVSPAPDGGYPGGNTAEGQSALLSLTTGGFNTAVGFLSLRSNTTGEFNTAIGAGTLLANVGDPSSGQGVENTATGAGALLSNTTGAANIANGAFTLFSNTTGNGNTATGVDALFSNTIGSGNNAVGHLALFRNVTGSFNTAIGDSALESNISGDGDVAVGADALTNNFDGFDNTAIGGAALASNRDSGDNTAVGFTALENSTSNSNTAVGSGALMNNTVGFNNTAIGHLAGLNQTTGSNNVYIGAGIQGVAGESDASRIASIFGQTAANGSAVFITSGNKLGTDTSSKRFKDNIKPMDKASEAILALRPVSFRYKKEIDPQGIRQFGLVAEEVEKVNPDLVVRDKEAKPYSVRYEQVNAMLLNEFLKEHRKIEKLEAALEAVNAHLKEQDSKIQKVSDETQLSRPAPRMVLSSP